MTNKDSGENKRSSCKFLDKCFSCGNIGYFVSFCRKVSIVQCKQQCNKIRNFIEDSAAPCLYVKKNESRGVYIALDVDGNLLIGDHGGIEEDIELLHKNGLIKKTKQHPQYFLEDQKLF